MSSNRISRDAIEKTHQALAHLNEEETRKAVKLFQKKQVGLLVYSAAISEREGFNDDEQDVFFSTVLVIWQVLLKQYPRMKSVSIEQLEKADDQAFTDLGNLTNASDADILRHVDVQLTSHPETELLRYVVENTMESKIGAVRDEMRPPMFLSLNLVLDQLLAACETD
jgi:hypothetical protein